MKVAIRFGFPAIATLASASLLMVGYHQGPFGCCSLLAEMERKCVGGVTDWHINQVLPHKQGIGRDFIQGNFG